MAVGALPPISLPPIGFDSSGRNPDDDVFDISDDFLKSQDMTDEGIKNLRENLGLGKKFSDEELITNRKACLQLIYRLPELVRDRQLENRALNALVQQAISSLEVNEKFKFYYTNASVTDRLMPFALIFWATIKAITKLDHDPLFLKFPNKQIFRISKVATHLLNQFIVECASSGLASFQGLSERTFWENFLLQISSNQSANPETKLLISSLIHPIMSNSEKLAAFSSEGKTIHAKLFPDITQELSPEATRKLLRNIFTLERTHDHHQELYDKHIEKIASTIEANHQSDPIFFDDTKEAAKALAQKISNDKRTNVLINYYAFLPPITVLDQIIKAKQIRHLVIKASSANDIIVEMYKLIKNKNTELTYTDYIFNVKHFLTNKFIPTNFSEYICQACSVDENDLRSTDNLTILVCSTIDRLKRLISKHQLTIDIVDEANRHSIDKSEPTLVLGHNSEEELSSAQNYSKISYGLAGINRKRLALIRIYKLLLEALVKSGKNLGYISEPVPKNIRIDTITDLNEPQLNACLNQAKTDLDPKPRLTTDINHFDYVWNRLISDTDDDDDNDDQIQTDPPGPPGLELDENQTSKKRKLVTT